jgi:hypothetical protein
MTTASNDIEIRKALHSKTLKKLHACPDTLIVDELGLIHAQARIDVAVINGCVHGFEIKSSTDSLDRLPRQLGLYSECLEKLTIVCAEKHTKAVRKLIPRWCGVLVASKGKRGAIAFETVRETRPNPFVDAKCLAHLLWRDEAVSLLARLDAPASILRRPRAELYQCIAELLTVPQITQSIKEFMASRRNWRYPPAHA